MPSKWGRRALWRRFKLSVLAIRKQADQEKYFNSGYHWRDLIVYRNTADQCIEIQQSYIEVRNHVPRACSLLKISEEAFNKETQ